MTRRVDDPLALRDNVTMFGRDNMRIIRSRVRTGSPDFQKRHSEMSALVAELNEALAQARAGGGEKYTTRHQKRGKLLPRERIELLLDPGGHFLELLPLAGHGIRGVGTGAGGHDGDGKERCEDGLHGAD